MKKNINSFREMDELLVRKHDEVLKKVNYDYNELKKDQNELKKDHNVLKKAHLFSQF